MAEPTKPHSSPTVQNIKSVLCSGTKLNFVVLICIKTFAYFHRSPTPKKPPEPIAILD